MIEVAVMVMMMVIAIKVRFWHRGGAMDVCHHLVLDPNGRETAYSMVGDPDFERSYC